MNGQPPIPQAQTAQTANVGPEVVEQPDGSAIVTETEPDEQTSDFEANLAESLSESDLTRIANDLLELIELDKDSRKRHDELYEEGLRRTGLGNDAPGGAKFDGASTAVHPVLAESCVDYASSAIKEIFPPDGPVKIHNFAEGTAPDEIERAEAKRDFMNWQLVDQIPEYRTDLEVLLTQQPLAGSQYLKIWWDPTENRPCVEFVPTDNVYLPYAASSLYTSGRFTLVVPLTRMEYQERIKSGMYRDANILEADSFVPETSAAEKANQKIEGKEDPAFNEDGLRDFFEVYVRMSLEEDDDPAPYIITIDKYSQKIVAIYRNWDEQDPLMRRLDWVVEFCFIPWRGAKGIGLSHLIGSLSGAATGALRALLDSAHLNNFPGAVKLKGARASGQNVSIGATEITEIEAPANVDDIRKLLMPIPFPQTSPVLFQLLGWLTDAAKGVVSTAEEKIADASNQMPVGTTLALIEQGSKVASAIHMRLHASQKKVLNIIQRLNFRYYDPQIQIRKFGRVLVQQQDFMDMGNVVPVSDPYMFSEAQRFAQIQGVLQMAQDPTVPWNKLAIYKRLLRLMHVSSPQEFIQEPPPPVSADPVTEIVAAMSGQQVQAQPQMNHMEHIQEELAYLLDPVFGAANPVLVNQGFSVILADIMQHLLFQFQQMKQQAAQMAQMQVMQLMATQMQGQVPPEMIPQLIQQQLQSPQTASMIKQLTQSAFAQMQQQMQPMVQALQQADKLVKSKIPPPQDPQAAAMLQVTQMQEQTKMQVAQMKSELDKAKLQQDAAEAQMRIELEKFVRTQLEMQKMQASAQTELLKNRDDNMQHYQTELEKNTDDNRTNLEMARMREQAEAERAIVTKQMEIDAQAQQAQIDAELAVQKGQQDLTRQVVTETMRSALERERMANDREMAKQAAKITPKSPAPKKDE